ncbi:MAG: hypothetical protein PVF58_22195 [Candidatus Methanofastidiosia archaeon]|jgi:hypothetical protein
MSVKTVSRRYKKILPQCKVLVSFFPLGFENYSPQFVIFKTEYEMGLKKGLRKLSCTTYLYKAHDMIMLLLFLPPVPQTVNKSTKRFKEMEENGVIHDLCASTPFRYHNIF